MVMHKKYNKFTPAFKSIFQPYAVESTGRIGKAALRLLDKLGVDSHICSLHRVNILKGVISSEMLKARADLIMSNRAKMQIAPVFRRSVSRNILPPNADQRLLVANPVHDHDIFHLLIVRHFLQ